MLMLFQDTRTHIVVELFNTEKSYVESLETVVKVTFNMYFLPPSITDIINL